MAQKEKKPNIIQRTKNWWRQTIGELRKVSWPTKEDALALTRIVLIVTVIMSAFWTLSSPAWLVFWLVRI